MRQNQIEVSLVTLTRRYLAGLLSGGAARANTIHNTKIKKCQNFVWNAGEQVKHKLAQPKLELLNSPAEELITSLLPVLGLIWSSFCSSLSGLYKGLQLSATSASILPSPSPMTSSPQLSLPPSNSISTTGSVHNAHNTLSNHGNNTASAAPQVLIGNNLRLSVATPQIASLNARHLPRSLSGVPPAALKLAAAASSCQLPKVTSG